MGVTSRSLIAIAFLLLTVVGCGNRSSETASGVETPSTGSVSVPTTRLGSTTLVEEPTLGVSLKQFVADWNRLLEVNDFLLIDEPDIDDGTSLTRQFADDWSLELTVDDDSGELTVAELRASTNVHTDQLLMRYFSMLSLVQASNSRLEFGWDEDFAWVTERLGLPAPDGGQDPSGFSTGNYETEGEIEGVLYRFEETDYNAVLTATPAP